MSYDFAHIIQSAYDVFGKYTRPNQPLCACTCPICLAPELEWAMRNTPLRELTGHHFYQYNDVLNGKQNAHELKYSELK